MKLELIEQRWTDKYKKQYMKLYSELLEVKKAGNKSNVAETKKKVSEIKNKMSEICPVFYGAVLSRGKKETYVIDFQDTPVDVKNFKQLIRDRYKEIKQKREQLKKFKSKSKAILGYKYETIGGVFSKPKTILNLVGTVDDDELLRQPKAPLQYNPMNYVGVEIECITKCSREFLEDCIIEAGLHRYIQLKGDSSINAEDSHPNTIEITVCAQESKIKTVINSLCALLRRRRIDAKANNSCGLHVHLDMRLRNAEIAYSNLFKAQDLLLSMLPSTRRSDQDDQARRYCKKNVASDLMTQKTKDRYHVINAQSLAEHKTLEIRAHSGTTNAEKINNWIDLLLLIVDAKEMKTVSTITELQSVMELPTALYAYVLKRVDKFKGKKIDTNEDERVA